MKKIKKTGKKRVNEGRPSNKRSSLQFLNFALALLVLALLGLGNRCLLNWLWGLAASGKLLHGGALLGGGVGNDLGVRTATLSTGSLLLGGRSRGGRRGLFSLFLGLFLSLRLGLVGLVLGLGEILLELGSGSILLIAWELAAGLVGLNITLVLLVVISVQKLPDLRYMLVILHSFIF